MHLLFPSDPFNKSAADEAYVEESEALELAAERELLEETGYPARAVHSLGAPASP